MRVRVLARVIGVFREHGARAHEIVEINPGADRRKSTPVRTAAMRAWHQEPKVAAWAGRTAAWAADAPKYSWQAVAAIVGATKATSFEHVVDSAADLFCTQVGS